MPLIELAGTRNSLENKLKNEGYFNVVISGCTKGNQISVSKFAFPHFDVSRSECMLSYL